MIVACCLASGCERWGGVNKTNELVFLVVCLVGWLMSDLRRRASRNRLAPLVHSESILNGIDLVLL